MEPNTEHPQHEGEPLPKDESDLLDEYNEQLAELDRTYYRSRDELTERISQETDRPSDSDEVAENEDVSKQRAAVERYREQLIALEKDYWREKERLRRDYERRLGRL